MSSPVQVEGGAESEALQQLATRYAAKLAAGTGVDQLADELEKTSGCSRRDATAFIGTLATTGLRPELSQKTLGWAAAFARRASAGIARTTLVRSSRFLLVGVVGVGVLVLWNPRGVAPDLRQILQLLVLGFGVPVIIGFLGLMAGGVSWLQYRGTTWPAPLADEPGMHDEAVNNITSGSTPR